jgi:Protein of unknown function (DUF3987)
MPCRPVGLSGAERRPSLAVAPSITCGASLLAGASAWIGNARRAEVSAARRAQPHLWLALIGPPSSGKTPGQLAAMAACATLECDARPEFDRAMMDHALKAEIAKVADEGWKAAVREARKNGTKATDRPADAVAPDAPPCGRVAINDSTIEELQNLLAQHPRGLSLLSRRAGGIAREYGQIWRQRRRSRVPPGSLERQRLHRRPREASQ